MLPVHSQPSTPKRVAQLTPPQCVRSPFAPGYVVTSSPFSKNCPVDHFNDDLLHVFKARISPCYTTPTGPFCSPMATTVHKVYDVNAPEHPHYNGYYISHRSGQVSSPSLSYSFKESIAFGGHGIVYSPPALTPMPSSYSSAGMPNVKGVISHDPMESGSNVLSTKYPLYEECGDLKISVTHADQLNSPVKNICSQVDHSYDDAQNFFAPACHEYGEYYHPHSELMHEDLACNPAYYPQPRLMQPHNLHEDAASCSYSCHSYDTGDAPLPPVNGSSTLSSFTTYSSASNDLGCGDHGQAPIQGLNQLPHSGLQGYIDSAAIDERIKAVPTLPNGTRYGKTKTKQNVPSAYSEIKKSPSLNSLHVSAGDQSDTYRPPGLPEATEDEKGTDGYAESDSSTTDCYVMRRKPCTNWAPEEDDALIKVVTALGTRNWKNVAKLVHRECPHLPERSADQCSQHWLRVLDPSIVKGKWTPEDDHALIEAVKLCPPRQWKMIANYVKGRTDIQVRYRMKRLAKSLLRRNILPREKLP